MNFGQYVAANVPSLRVFREESMNFQIGINALKALSSVMFLLLRYEFKTNHGEWVKAVKPRLGSHVSDQVNAAMDATHEDIKTLYKVRSEMRAALRSLLKDDGILVVPTVADPPLKLNSKKGPSAEFLDRAFALLSIASMSGCCEEQVSLVSNLSPVLDTNGHMDASELLKEKGNAAFKGNQLNKAVSYYSEAIKLNDINPTYYCNRAAAYLKLGCYREAEEDCTKAITLDKKNVKAYLRRGTARESLVLYKDALQDFKYALVLEPQNKDANEAEKRLRKLIR